MGKLYLLPLNSAGLNLMAGRTPGSIFRKKAIFLGKMFWAVCSVTGQYCVMRCRAIADQQSAQINHFLNPVSMATLYSFDEFPLIHYIHLAWTKVNTTANELSSSIDPLNALSILRL